MSVTINSASFVAQMRKALAGVSEAMGEDTLRAVGAAGARVLRDEAKLNASRRSQTGTIYNNIIVKRAEERSDGARMQVYFVMVRSGHLGREGDAYYWRWVEDGHKIVPRKPKKTSWKQHRAAAELEYGGRRAPAYPYMRPAFDARQQDAIEAMKKMLQTQISARQIAHGRGSVA